MLISVIDSVVDSASTENGVDDVDFNVDVVVVDVSVDVVVGRNIKEKRSKKIF